MHRQRDRVKVCAALFFLITVIETIVSATGPAVLRFWLKGAPLLLLVIESGGRLRKSGWNRLSGFIWLGLVFSLVADIAIEYSFLAGLAFFLGAHIMYIIAMSGFRGPIGKQFLAALPAGLFLGGMLSLVASRVPSEMLVPVIVYATTISIMLAVATIRAFVTERNAISRLMWFGALLFLISDSVIALNRWVTPMTYASPIILATYYTGQWFISRGAALNPISPVIASGSKAIDRAP